MKGIFLEVPTREPMIAGPRGEGAGGGIVTFTVLNPNVTEEQKDVIIRILEGDEATDLMLKNRATFIAALEEANRPWWKRLLGV